jgi:glycerophosphoryl diester phosphodiesterase
MEKRPMNTTPPPFLRWPYPRWIAHRGAGKRAPENTLAAFKLGAQHGYRMFECDVKLSADGVPFLLHDATLERTTNGTGTAGQQPWSQLGSLDAGRWHSAAFAGEPLPTLAALAQLCIQEGWLLNIEIKPTPGVETLTGQRVAEAVRALWAQATVPPLLTSFEPQALAAARAAAPALPIGLLVHQPEVDWLVTAQSLGCVAVVLHHPLWTLDAIARAHAHALKALAYTVNDPARAEQLLAWGLDGLITDEVHAFKPG